MNAVNFNCKNGEVEFFLIENSKEVKSLKTIYTKLEFYQMFSKEKLVAFWNSQDTEILYFQVMLTAFNAIDIENTETKQAIQYLVYNNFITQTKYDEIYGIQNA